VKVRASNNLTGSEVLNVGKNKGKTYDEILQCDMGYCEWVVKQDNLHGELANFQQFCSKQGITSVATSGVPPQHPTTTSAKITGGKYSGLTFADVLSKDTDYCSWIMSVPEKELRAAWMKDFKAFLASNNFRIQPRKSLKDQYDAM
jgi:hypothetical protein